MFKLIRCGARLKIVDVILNSKVNIKNNVNNHGNSRVKFSYINDKMFSKNMNSKVKKRRYRNGNR